MADKALVPQDEDLAAAVAANLGVPIELVREMVSGHTCLPAEVLEHTA